MASTVTLAGSNFSIPDQGDTGWAQGAGNLSSYLIAIASVTLQTTGGTFSLSAPVNFGSTYGLLAAYFTSVTASPATAGIVRLALSDEICWGTGNLALSVSASRLYFNGNELALVSELPPDITQYAEYYIAGTAKNNYTGSLTVVNMVGTYAANGVNLFVFVNGLLNTVTVHYTETSTTSITFGSSLNTGDIVTLRWTTF